MEVKPGYKQTEVGIIPEEWEVSTARSRVRYHQLGNDARRGRRTLAFRGPTSAIKAVQCGRIEINDFSRPIPMTRTDIERLRLRKGDIACLRRVVRSVAPQCGTRH